MRLTADIYNFNPGGNPMRCNRCKGTMSYEKFYGAQENFWGWRCIRCGEIVDATILENRGPMDPDPMRGLKRRRH
ncbi:MAG TPA: hypothetical protein VEM15_05130 [Thermodesulfobacteriota bacterium]|nr:hypothetical protein [Thermodesulfobacteriota bacterium]